MSGTLTKTKPVNIYMYIADGPWRDYSSDQLAAMVKQE